jgi:putative (di)nucleoside polyphosphate hydrolase
VGLEAEHVSIQACSRDWLRYRLPKRLIRHHSLPLCIGQKQIWFLLNMECDDSQVRFDCCDKPEFDHWRWINYWRPAREVVAFKRRVYAKVLREFAPLVVGMDNGQGDSVIVQTYVRDHFR